MIKNVYSIRDYKTHFLDPFVDANDDSAMRGFAYSVVNHPDIIAFAPSDFALYRVGTFDSNSAAFTSIVPVFLMSGSDAMRGVSNEES